MGIVELILWWWNVTSEILRGEEDESLITKDQISDLENGVKKIQDSYSSFESFLNGLKSEKLQSLVLSLQGLFVKFFEILGRLDGHEEYLEKKDIFLSDKNIKDKKQSSEREIKWLRWKLRDLDKAEWVIIRTQLELKKDASKRELLKSLGLPMSIKFEAEFLRDNICSLRQHYEIRNAYAEGRRILIDCVKQSLYNSLWFWWNDLENNKILKNYEKFIKKYEYDFGQLEKCAWKIMSLWKEIKTMIDELNNSGDDGREQQGSDDNYFLSKEDVGNEKFIPEDLKSLFDELKKKGINNNRLKVILQKQYESGKIIPSRFIQDWVLLYNLFITPAELEFILCKVFTILKEEKDEESNISVSDDWWSVIEGFDSVVDSVVDQKNQHLKSLTNMYKKLDNNEIESSEFYCCFFNILKDYLSLQIDNEKKLIKQFKSFENHNYFYKDIIYVSESIIKKGMKPSVIGRNERCTKTWKVIKFPKGLHSKVRIIITDDDKIVGLYSHADYVRYFWWSKERKS